MNESALVYAGFGRRLLAAFIDNVTWVVLYLTVYGGVVSALYDESPEAGFIAFFVYASVWFNYFTFMEWRSGQTLGKIAAEIEVKSLDGKERLSFGQASIRNLLRLVDVFLIGPVMVATTKRKQRLGDKAAKTVVLRAAPKAALTPAVRGAAEPPAQAAPAPAPPAEPESGKPAKPSRLPAVPWDVSDTVWGLVGGLILGVVVAPALVLPFDPDLSSDGALLAAQGLLGTSLLFVAIGMASRWKFSPLRETFAKLGLRRFRPSALGIGLLTLIVYYIAAAIFAALVLTPEQDDIGGELGIGDSNLVIAVTAVVLIAVLAPFAEELFFRGFIFGGIRARWSLWPAALSSGLIFGLIHAPTGITTVVPLAGLGVALCWLYDRTGSLWPCVMAHAINNGLALAVTAAAS